MTPTILYRQCPGASFSFIVVNCHGGNFKLELLIALSEFFLVDNPSVQAVTKFQLDSMNTDRSEACRYSFFVIVACQWRSETVKIVEFLFQIFVKNVPFVLRAPFFVLAQNLQTQPQSTMIYFSSKMFSLNPKCGSNQQY